MRCGGYMTCQIFICLCTYEEEQGISYVLEFLYFTNLHDKSKPNRYLTYLCGGFNQCVVNLKILFLLMVSKNLKWFQNK